MHSRRPGTLHQGRARTAAAHKQRPQDRLLFLGCAKDGLAGMVLRTAAITAAVVFASASLYRALTRQAGPEAPPDTPQPKVNVGSDGDAPAWAPKTWIDSSDVRSLNAQAR